MVFPTMVKDQILLAQDKCYSLMQKNKLKRSSSRNQRVKKLKRKIQRLTSYFMDSVLVIRSDGSKIRRLKTTHFKIDGTGPKSKYVSSCKRRKLRPPKRIHSGPFHAPSSIYLPQTKDDGTSKLDNLKTNVMKPSLAEGPEHVAPEINNKLHVTQDPRGVDDGSRHGHAYDMKRSKRMKPGSLFYFRL